MHRCAQQVRIFYILKARRIDSGNNGRYAHRHEKTSWPDVSLGAATSGTGPVRVDESAFSCINDTQTRADQMQTPISTQKSKRVRTSSTTWQNNKSLKSTHFDFLYNTFLSTTRKDLEFHCFRVRIYGQESLCLNF